jgi:pyrroloquinoline-quinone synthase
MATLRSIDTLVQEMEAGLHKPGRWLPEHPVIGKLQRGELSRGQIAGMMGQIYAQTTEVVRWLGALYAKCPIKSVRREIFNNLLEEELGHFSGTDAHFDLARRVGEAAGATREEMENVTLLPATARLIELGEHMFYEETDWVAAFGTAFGFEYQSPMAFGPIAEALKASYGMSDHDVEFFSVHVTADEDHTGAIVKVIEKYASGSDTHEKVKQAAWTYGDYYHGMMSTYEAFK